LYICIKTEKPLNVKGATLHNRQKFSYVPADFGDMMWSEIYILVIVGLCLQLCPVDNLIL